MGTVGAPDPCAPRAVTYDAHVRTRRRHPGQQAVHKLEICVDLGYSSRAAPRSSSWPHIADFAMAGVWLVLRESWKVVRQPRRVLRSESLGMRVRTGRVVQLPAPLRGLSRIYIFPSRRTR